MQHLLPPLAPLLPMGFGPLTACAIPFWAKLIKICGLLRTGECYRFWEREGRRERETHRNKAFFPSGLIPLFKAHEFVNGFVADEIRDVCGKSLLGYLPYCSDVSSDSTTAFKHHILFSMSGIGNRMSSSFCHLQQILTQQNINDRLNSNPTD